MLVEPPSQPLFALVTQWEPKNGGEGDYSEYCTNAVPEFISDELKGFLSFLLSIERYFCWNLLKSYYFFLVLKFKRQLLSGPS